MAGIPGRRENGRAVNLAIGPSCFVQCHGCYNHFGRTTKRGGLVRAAEVLSFLDDAVAIGLEQVTFSGGDPLSHPDILEILDGAKALGLFIKVDTVGTALLGPAETVFYGNGTVDRVPAVELVRASDMIGIPLDGFSAKVQEKFRKKRPELNRESVEIIRMLVSLGGSVCVNTVVNKHNLVELPKMGEMLVDIRPALWQLFEYQPTGPLGQRNQSTYLLGPGVFDDTVGPLVRRLEGRLAVQAKSRATRSGIYVLVDDAGIAWTPGSGEDRVEHGHITKNRGQVIDFLRTHFGQPEPLTA